MTIIAGSPALASDVLVIQANALSAVTQLAQVIDAKEHGCIGDGQADDTAALQAVLTGANGPVMLPSGTYKISAPIVWGGSGVLLQGAGMEATIIKCTFATGDILTNTSGRYGGIADMSITSTVQRTAGAAVRFTNGHSISASRVKLDLNHFWGFQFDGGASQFIYSLIGFEVNSGSIGIVVGGDGSVVQDLWVSQGVIASQTLNGMLFLNVSGAYFSEIDTILCAQGISTFPAAGQTVGPLWFTNVLADTCPGGGWVVNTNGGIVADWTMTGCWGSTCGSNGNKAGMAFSGAGVSHIMLTNPRCINNYGHGIQILTGVQKIHILNPDVCSNSQSSDGSNNGNFHGISIGGTVTNWSITGGVCGSGGVISTNPQGYGIFQGGTGSSNYKITGVDLTGNFTGTMIDAGTGAAIVRDNTGYNPVGASAITVGSSPFSYTAGHCPETVYVTQGVVTGIFIGVNALFVSTDKTIDLGPNETFTVTYTTAPAMNKSVH